MSADVDVKTLVIDEQEVSARAGQTILEVARENEIDIPTLCHMDGLSEVGACRLCLVEIKGSNKLLPACVATVQEGMEVSTSTERLKKHRRTILELLFAERNHICSVCVANGHCELQTLAQEQGLTHVRLPYRNPNWPWTPLTSALRGPQPLHPVHAVRAGLCRDRGGARVGRDGPGDQLDDHLRPARGVGRLQLHALRQMRAGVPHRSSVRQSKIGSEHPKYPDFLPC